MMRTTMLKVMSVIMVTCRVTPLMLIFIARNVLGHTSRVSCGDCSDRCDRYDTALDELVELPPVKPNPAALGTIINLDPGTLGHDEIGSGTHWTFHDAKLSESCSSSMVTHQA